MPNATSPTELVKEFTELQGVVGGLYARAQGEPEEVWQAIYDHYKPESMADYIPSTSGSRQLVSTADKLDTLRECFRIGMAPTGSRDPFALRRAAQGVVKIIVEGRLNVPLDDMIRDIPGLIDVLRRSRQVLFPRCPRLRATTKSTPPWPQAGAICQSWYYRLNRLKAIRPSPDFEPLAGSFKRIKNILRQAEFQGGPFDAGLLEPGPESELFDEISRSAGQPIENVIGALRPIVDRYFDKVLVNAPEPAVRNNRLAMLHGLLEQFRTFADFSEIVTNS